MLGMLLDFANLLLAALLVGTIFGVWLSFNPAGLDAAAYISQQQHGIRALNVTMPVMGGLTVLLTMMAAVMARDDRTRLFCLIGAAAGFLAAGLITRFLNQPINTIVITWTASTPPSDWTHFRDEWWRWHVVRLACGLVGLCLLIIATLKRAAH